MSRILVPSSGVESWKSRLADPIKHWKRESSAFETAVSWENAARTKRGIPTSIAQVLDHAPDAKGAVLLFALPEHRVPLPGGRRPSQTDVWAVLKGPQGLISMAVEGKADEAFGDTLAVWQRTPSEGKAQRLAYLQHTLGCADAFPSDIRYQLLHRTASAIIEARRIGASVAVMMVHSFRQRSDSENDFAAFGNCLGASLHANALAAAPRHQEPKLYLGWATSPLCTDQDIAAAAT